MCILATIRTVFFPPSYYKLSLNTHFSRTESQRRWGGGVRAWRRGDAIDRMAWKKVEFPLYDLWWMAFLPLAYLHWYQANSRWQPSKSLSAHKNEMQMFNRRRKAQTENPNRVIYLDFSCVSNYLWSFDPFFHRIFAVCTAGHRRFIKCQFYLFEFRNISQYFYPFDCWRAETANEAWW